MEGDEGREGRVRVGGEGRVRVGGEGRVRVGDEGRVRVGEDGAECLDGPFLHIPVCPNPNPNPPPQLALMLSLPSLLPSFLTLTLSLRSCKGSIFVKLTFRWNNSLPLGPRRPVNPNPWSGLSELCREGSGLGLGLWWAPSPCQSHWAAGQRKRHKQRNTRAAAMPMADPRAQEAGATFNGSGWG